LNFEKSPDGRIGSGIYSKDQEYIPFHKDIVLEGAVETYLKNLEQHVRIILRDILENARNTAENWETEKPREICQIIPAVNC
jgi:dynein heavy chain